MLSRKCIRSFGIKMFVFPELPLRRWECFLCNQMKVGKILKSIFCYYMTNMKVCYNLPLFLIDISIKSNIQFAAVEGRSIKQKTKK